MFDLITAMRSFEERLPEIRASLERYAHITEPPSAYGPDWPKIKRRILKRDKHQC
jgi:hypothetical protein